jgi:solute carrier family 25 uncoupling protein 27
MRRTTAALLSLALGCARVRAEGVRGLYAGVAPAMVRHVPYSGTRIVVYEAARSRLGGSAHEVLHFGSCHLRFAQ